jgi:serine/threonine protein kinase
MALAAGTRLGPYEILASIGAGGMGEVYRAKDTKLKRDVALKVLPAAFAQDPERMLRFQREAEVLASLNHLNIAQIYGVEERALVMELVDGQTLQGPLPLETALNYARQIADALEAAHEKNIIHRDLKPANIMTTPAGVVKVLDFGLAAVAQSSDPSNPANSPTLTISPPRAGMILGTASYMSPEQARGKAVDKRADIWAFGVVLFELLTGKRLFDGETVSDTLAAVLKTEPDLNQVPAKVRRLLEACLQKDPKQRLQAIGDWRLVLTDMHPQAAPAPKSKLPWAVATVFALAFGALAFVHFREKVPVMEEMRFQIQAPENATLGPLLKLSPDGHKLAFSAGSRLWVHFLESGESRDLTADGGTPFWSPDSRYIGYPSEGKLKKIAATGGPPQTVADLHGRWGGGTWNQDDVIVFADLAVGLFRVSASGGVPVPITAFDPARRETLHAFPSFLPDGRHFVYTRRSSDLAKSAIYLGSVDVKPDQQSSKPLANSNWHTECVPSADPV